MNNLLQLKGQFQKRANSGGGGPVNLPKGKIVSAVHLRELIQQLKSVYRYWENRPEIGGTLVSAYYYHIVAKSNRLKTLLGEGSKSPNESVRGVRFIQEDDATKKHLFTHFVSRQVIKDTIEKLELALKIVERDYGGRISHDDIEAINKGHYRDKKPARTVFVKIIVDAYYLERFGVDQEYEKRKITNDSIITIYKTGVDTISLLSKFGIDMINAEMLNDTTLRLTPDEIKILQDKAPYLIAMDVVDFSKISFDEPDYLKKEEQEKILSIPKPGNEPVIGVIDTQFDEFVYFHEWVDYRKVIRDDFDLCPEDYIHGTEVSSIIVDGPSFNPDLDDGCGRFRVRHFGVSVAKGFSSFTILKMIRNIVMENPDIKVWNLSLGSAMEIHENFISPEAAELDRIQSEYDVIFVIAGTNKPKNEKKKDMRIGAPADSLNSLVVNAVDFHGKQSSYTRTGPVLSFFHKPDVSYYGGDGPDKIIVCDPLGKAYVTGTSFAAPWITRKIAYLIYVMGLNREVAKALIIDSAAGWEKRDTTTLNRTGYGIVPKRIEDILQSQDDEIRFIMTGTIEDFETYTYNIPVPQDMKGFPYFARATLAYFPKSDRNQGVDYTGTEMDIHFGRIQEKNGKPTIKSIDQNKQSEDGPIILYEEEARQMYRKWDNIKHIKEIVKSNARSRKVYGAGMWGLSIKTKERAQVKAGRGLQFGVVITLKEMNGVNRIDEFVKLCMMRGWIVNELIIENQIDIYIKAEEEIEFE